MAPDGPTRLDLATPALVALDRSPLDQTPAGPLLGTSPDTSTSESEPAGKKSEAKPLFGGRPNLRGRPKGVRNKASLEIKETARRFLSNRKGLAALRRQYEAGDLDPGILKMFYHYGFGKPEGTAPPPREPSGPALNLTQITNYTEVNLSKLTREELDVLLKVVRLSEQERAALPPAVLPPTDDGQ